MSVTEPGPNEEDECYEVYMAETTKVYRLEGEELVLEQEFCGLQPNYEMLDTTQVCFTCTIYNVWVNLYE